MFDIAGVMEEYIDNTYAYEGIFNNDKKLYRDGEKVVQMIFKAYRRDSFKVLKIYQDPKCKKSNSDRIEFLSYALMNDVLPITDVSKFKTYGESLIKHDKKIEDSINKFNQKGYKVSPQFVKKNREELDTMHVLYTDLCKAIDILAKRMNEVEINTIDAGITVLKMEQASYYRRLTIMSKINDIFKSVEKGE